MLGIIIGIAAVLAILSVGNGLKRDVSTRIDDIGTTAVRITINEKKTDRLITKDHIRRLSEDIPEIKGISVSTSLYGNVITKRDSYECSVSGGTEITQGTDKMLKGRYYSASDVESGSGVLVLSEYSARLLFGSIDVVGQTLEVSSGGITAEAMVVGVRENNSTDELYRAYFDDYVMMNAPYTWFENTFYYFDEGYSSISVYADPLNKDEVLNKAKIALESYLDLRGEGAVTIDKYADNTDSLTSILDTVTLVVALVAAISLIVGGIGVMNIMTVSVTERTREIGIRKALGARTSYILVQFLAESAILTLVGGLIGVVIGLAGGAAACHVANFPFVIDPVSIIVVVGISTAVGLFFGIYPARRAAGLDPIEALRAE